MFDLDEVDAEEQEAEALEVAPADEPEQTAADEPNPEDELKKLKRRVARRQRLFHLADEATNSVGWGVWIIAIVVAVLFLIPIALGLKSSLVLTESMTGAINKGDVALTLPFDQKYGSLQVGDVALIDQGEGGQFIHRITSVRDDGTYVTKGDANNRPDVFKPTNEDIDGVLFNVLKQPVSGILALFSVNFEWFDMFGSAIAAGQWNSVWSLLALAPWGFLILALTAFIFWSVIPRLLQKIINRANLKAAVERARIKRAVEGHDESLTEIEPVIEELKQDYEHTKAEKAESFAAALAQESTAWDALANGDAVNFWNQVEEEDDDEAIAPAPTPALTPGEHVRALIEQRKNTTQNVPAHDLGALPDLDAQSHADTGAIATAQATVFDLEQDD